MRKISFLCLALMMFSFAKSQTIADAVKMLNYGKIESTKSILDKLLAANPKDAAAIYWLGQTHIEDDELALAKTTYQKALQDGVNDPYLWVGMAHVDLLNGGDINAAKQKFEQAITATTEIKGRNKGKTNPAILNAIGRANCIGRLASDGSSRFGDALYAVEQLKRASVTDPTSAEYGITMGICFRKLGSEYGGDAQKAYMEAVQRDSKNAYANYLIGKIYLTQKNKPLIDQYFNAAIAADPSFPRVYLDYYNYYSNVDVNMAKDNLEKYLQYADKDCHNDFFYADYLYRAGKYAESLAKAKELENGHCKDKVDLLNAYNNEKLGDSVKAKESIEKYFTATTADKLNLADYEIAAKILSKFNASASQAVSYIQKSMEIDTAKNSRIIYAMQAADIMGKADNCSEQVKWLQKVSEIKGSTSEAEHYKITNIAFTCKDYNKALQLAKAYLTAYPDKPQPASFLRKSAIALDADSITGAAIEHLDFLNSVLEKDVEKNKNAIFKNLYYNYLIYGAKIKDYPKALTALDKMLVIFPTAGTEANTFATTQKELIKNLMSRPAKPAAPTGGNKAPATPPAKGAAKKAN